MKHKNLSWAQRQRNGRARLKRLMANEIFNSKDMTVRKELARVHSEIRQRSASRRIKLKEQRNG